jgi:hypothetical protein|tara:strand:+ start:100 stop:462 length:363 start_codon:yes stop_codon:yes gene_type:complete
MLSYYISQSNEFVVRTRNTGSNDVFTLKLQDMLTYQTSSYALSGSYSFNPYENILTYSQSLEGNVETGQEFFVEISGSNSGSIYFGSMQIYSSQSIDKVVYTTQNDEFVSNTTDNEYIVI